MTSVGFIGLGNMGGPMATNLIKAGFELKVFDLLQSTLDKLVQAGASRCTSALEAAADVAILISMLPASRQVENLYLGSKETGDKGILAKLSSKTLVIDCSTIAPSSARKVAAAARARSIKMIDAPVSGGVGGSVAGTLTFIVGGSDAAFAAAKPLLEAMGKNIFHAGDAGSGQVAKICNNMLLSVLMTGTAEALQLGVDNGLDAAVLSEIMRVSSGGNWALEVYNPYPGVMDKVPAANNYAGGFLVDLMIKDLGLAMESSLETGTATPMGALARNLYVNHGKSGFGRKDFSSIQQVFNKD